MLKKYAEDWGYGNKLGKTYSFKHPECSWRVGEATKDFASNFEMTIPTVPKADLEGALSVDTSQARVPVASPSMETAVEGLRQVEAQTKARNEARKAPSTPQRAPRAESPQVVSAKGSPELVKEGLEVARGKVLVSIKSPLSVPPTPKIPKIPPPRPSPQAPYSDPRSVATSVRSPATIEGATYTVKSGPEAGQTKPVMMGVSGKPVVQVGKKLIPISEESIQYLADQVRRLRV